MNVPSALFLRLFVRDGHYSFRGILTGKIFDHVLSRVILGK